MGGWVGGAVINFDGLYMSWSDTLLDFISIVSSQMYMKTILDVRQNFNRMPFCTQVHLYNISFLVVFFYTLAYKSCRDEPCFQLDWKWAEMDKNELWIHQLSTGIAAYFPSPFPLHTLQCWLIICYVPFIIMYFHQFQFIKLYKETPREGSRVFLAR